jgi:polyisoprenyl-teichoic acid--peptidoglycan teichoic acid transferase
MNQSPASRRLMLAWIIPVLLLVIGFSATAPAAAQDDEDETPTPEVIIARWDEQSRFTIMIAGIDRRPDQSNTLQVRTDALMLVNIDPAEQHVGILHIPRDLFFAMPPTDNNPESPLVRVNTLLLRGEERQEGYGPYLVMDTLQYNLGIYVDAYILFDFEAFIDIVDALGGVDITTTYPISDPTYPDMNYGFDPFYLEAGEHTLDGETALKFVRTRHNDNDYERGDRQIQMVRAVIEKATSPRILPGLLLQAPDLLEDLEGKLYTDLTLADAIALAGFAADLPDDAIDTAVIERPYITGTATGDGSSGVTIKRDTIAELLEEVFGEGYSG